MTRSRQWPSCGALRIAAVLVAGCTDSTEPPGPPAPPVEATLAFTMDSSIFVISTEEGATPSLFLSGFINPSWSPDGQTLAMVATGAPLLDALPPRQALYLADADGSNPRALTELDDLIGPIHWSPDGSTILFLRVHTRIPGSSRVARVAAAGGAEDAPFGDFEDGVRFNHAPSWSGDGARVVLDHGGTIVVANADGSGRTPLTAGSTPRWSPTSDDIAYWNAGRIHLIHPDGSGDRDLGLEGIPESWSPDGSRLAFVKLVGLGLESWIVGADGSNPMRIGPEGAIAGGVAWSADSKRITYEVSALDDPVLGRSTIYLASPNGSGARPLVASQIVCCVSWRPFR